MEVLLRPALNGCLFALMSVMTLGLFPLLQRMGQRHFILRMDESGLATRGGRRIAWSEITQIRRVVGTMKGATMSDEYLIRSSKGKASLPLWRARNADEAAAYLIRSVPPGVRP
jgi:hypothetical protein